MLIFHNAECHCAECRGAKSLSLSLSHFFLETAAFSAKKMKRDVVRLPFSLCHCHLHSCYLNFQSFRRVAVFFRAAKVLETLQWSILSVPFQSSQQWANMSRQRRYSPSCNVSSSGSIIKGPSSIYSTTSNVLGAGSYLGDNASSLRTTESSLSAWRYPKASFPTAPTAMSTTARTGTSPFSSSLQPRSRSARLSSSLVNGDSDSFRLRSEMTVPCLLIENNFADSMFGRPNFWSTQCLVE